MKGNNFTDMEIGKLIVIQEVIDGKKTGKQASDKLDLSERQIWRLVAKVKKQGNIGIKQGNCFNKNPRFMTNDFKKHIKDLELSEDYCDTNFTHFQDRLITEFKLANVHTIEEANVFFKTYIKKYNKRFAIDSKSKESYFVPVPSYLNLDLLLSIKLTDV